jgi:hypothetical protein
MHLRARRATSVALSIALHALLLLWVATIAVPLPEMPQSGAMPVRIIEPRARPKAPASKPPPQQLAKAPPPEPAKPDIPPPEPPPKPEPERKIPLPEQIVQQPDKGKNEAPPDTRFKSERDTKVEKEQVKRGEPKPGESQPEVKPQARPAPRKPPAPPRPQPARNAPPGRESQQLARLPTLDRLLPDAVRLAQEGYGQPPEIAQDAPEEQPHRSLTGGNDGLFIPSGPIGTLDYLPDVREGDITLLNTKAEMFAPFVRRVAIRVFQNFWISLKKDLTAPIAAQEQVEAEAVMDPRGEMIGFTITRRSSRVTLGSDRRLQQACNVGFFDRNPPPGARWEDGNIHFILATEIQMLGPQGGMVILAAGLK